MVRWIDAWLWENDNGKQACCISKNIIKTYLGGWKEGAMHGEGKYEWLDGRIFKRVYENNLK